MYKVIVRFKDLKDNGHLYNEGDTYPRKGKRASKARIAELSSTENKRGVALIAEVDEDEEE